LLDCQRIELLLGSIGCVGGCNPQKDGEAMSQHFWLCKMPQRHVLFQLQHKKMVVIVPTPSIGPMGPLFLFPCLVELAERI